VSRRHAVLGRDEPSSREGGEGGEGGGGGWWVEDAGSFHGTYVNGRLIRARTPLAHDACVQIGDVLVTLRDTTGAASGASAGRFEPAGTFLRPDLTAADAPARLVLLQGPGVGTVLRLDDGPVSLGGVAGSTVRLDEPDCEAIDVVIRPVAGRGFEVVRRGGPVTIYVSVRSYERRLLWNNDVLLLEHDDGRVLSELRFREAGSVATARLPGTPLPVGAEAGELPPSWARWFGPSSSGSTGPRSANPSGRLDQAELAAAIAEQIAREAALAREAAMAEQATTAALAEPATTAPTEPAAPTEPTATAEPTATTALAETTVQHANAEGASQQAPTSRPGVRIEPPEVPASSPHERDESGAGSERRARRARWALAASLTFTLAAAAGAALWPRSPEPHTPEAAVGATTRPSAEPTGAVVATSAAVEPAGAPTTEAPTLPGTASTTARRTPAVGAAGAQRVAVVRPPASLGREEAPDPRDERTAEARIRARLESRAKAGRASAGELVQLRKLCVQQGDAACLGRLETFTRQRSELDL
jgi:FHA domain